MILKTVYKQRLLALINLSNIFTIFVGGDSSKLKLFWQNEFTAMNVNNINNLIFLIMFNCFI